MIVRNDGRRRNFCAVRFLRLPAEMEEKPVFSVGVKSDTLPHNHQIYPCIFEYSLLDFIER